MTDQIKNFSAENNCATIVNQCLKLLIVPFATFIIVGSLNYTYQKFIAHTWNLKGIATINSIENILYWLVNGLIIWWFGSRIIDKVVNYLLSTALFKNHPTPALLLPFANSIIKIIIFLSIFNAIVPKFDLPLELSFVLEKFFSILVICTISWLLFKVINIAEQFLFHYYAVKTSKEVTVRKLYTQILILKRIVLAFLLILTLGSILMLFDTVRALGASVLTTAGVIGLVLTFTAQRSLTSLFAGLEIAVTQPIKIGDAVVIEDKFGFVEEINFRHVIIKLWDWRRLIIPTTYFLEKPFQNWSKEESTNLIGTVNLFVDYTLPIASLREKLTEILRLCPLWDTKVNSIQISDLTEHVMELRVLCSARTPKDCWDLQCEVREKLISFIVQNYPTCLPISRSKQLKPEI